VVVSCPQEWQYDSQSDNPRYFVSASRLERRKRRESAPDLESDGAAASQSGELRYQSPVGLDGNIAQPGAGRGDVETNGAADGSPYR
jgi:hypothetical protein